MKKSAKRVAKKVAKPKKEKAKVQKEQPEKKKRERKRKKKKESDDEDSDEEQIEEVCISCKKEIINVDIRIYIESNARTIIV